MAPCDFLAFSIAAAATADGSMALHVSPLAPPHPEPFPSSVRTVLVIEALVVSSYANNPREFASACAVKRASMNPVDTSPAAAAGPVTSFTAAARSAGVGNAETETPERFG